MINDAVLLFGQRNNFAFVGEDDALYGLVEGVSVLILCENEILKIRINVVNVSYAVISAVNEALRNACNMKSKPLVQEQKGKLEVVLGIHAGYFREQDAAWVFKTIVRSAVRAGAVNNQSCKSCGGYTNNMVYINGDIQNMCRNCCNGGNERFGSGETMDAPFNWFTGIIGAFFGAMVGAIPWAVVQYFGWYIGLLAFTIGVASFYGYKLFKGPKVYSGAYAIIVTCSIVTILLVNFLSVLLVMFQYYWVITPSSILYFIRNYYNVGSFVMDTAFALLIGVMGIRGIGFKISEYTNTPRYSTRA